MFPKTYFPRDGAHNYSKLSVSKEEINKICSRYVKYKVILE